MKFCKVCDQEKSEEDFNWKIKAQEKRCATCRDCMRKHIQNHYKNNVVYYVEKAARRSKAYRKETYQKLFSYFLTHPCVDCGEADPIVLEFDHIEKETKLAAVSEWVWLQRPWRIILEEIKKCEVRCANCHRRKTAKERGYGLYLLTQ